MKRWLIPIGLLMLLSACGFHLRGTLDVPKWLTNIAIISKSRNIELVSSLQRQLEAYNIRVNPEPEDAQYWLIINDVDFQQNIVSIGSSTNPRQYQLVLKIGFSVQTRKAQIILPEQHVQVGRQFTSNNDRILGSNDEQHILIAEMQRDAAIQIINRIASSKSTTLLVR